VKYNELPSKLLTLLDIYRQKARQFPLCRRLESRLIACAKMKQLGSIRRLLIVSALHHILIMKFS